LPVWLSDVWEWLPNHGFSWITIFTFIKNHKTS
jgi:hypothetical protein